MDDGNTVRKLRAIMFTDIVGYTKMMQVNESEALKLLQKHKDVVSEISAKYGGNIIKHIGDEILVESESAVMLVHCAKELQKYFNDRNTTVPKSRELWVRIGIHIGDVIVKDDDIFGDGVNIASRIRPIANPGGIVITHSVLILLGNQDDIKCNFVGNKKFKNVKDKIQVYEVLLDSQPHLAIDPKIPFKMSKDTLLKVVLPISMTVFFIFLMFFLMFFNNISDYEEAYFRSDMQSVRKITRDFKSIKNVKANYFNISAADIIDGPGIINYYYDIHKKNPNDPKANFYLALSYLNFSTGRNQLDSAYALFKETEKLGINSVYFHIAKLQLYKKLDLKSSSVDIAENLIKYYPENPLAVVKSAEIYKDFCNDDKKAERLYRNALDIFPEYSEAFNGLSHIEIDRYNYAKAKILSDSALAINPKAIPSIETALDVHVRLSEFDNARKILNVLPDNSLLKYLGNAKLCLLENEPSLSLQFINDGLAEFPGKTELVRAYDSVEKTIILSDSIQKKESSVSRGKNKWLDSWEDAVNTSAKEQKPLLIVALDNEKLSSKYLELALSQKDILKLSNETVLYKVYKHKDAKLIDELGIKEFPTMIFTDQNKRIINSFTNSNGLITDKEFVNSFISESIVLHKKINQGNRDTEENKYKIAKTFTEAEELALEFEWPIMVVLSSRKFPASDTFLKQTIFNPGFMKNYKRTILLSIEDAEITNFAKKYKVNKFPSVLFFDEDINLISTKYGVMPQKVLAKEIDKIKLYRKRKDIPKEEINWIYDAAEAEIYAKQENKPVFVYFSLYGNDTYFPGEKIFSDYDMIKKINTAYIPLYINSEANKYYIEEDLRILPSVGLMNEFGDLIYHSYLPDDSFRLNSLLDYKTNSDMVVSLGPEKFDYFLQLSEIITSLLRNKLYSSAEKEVLFSIVQYPSFAYNIIDLASLFLSSNDFLTAEHYLHFLEDKDFLVSDRFMEILVSSFMLYDDFYRLSDFLNILLVKFKDNPIAMASLYSALAEINLAESQTIDAINFAQKAHELEPKRIDNLTLLGQLNYTINKSLSEKYFTSALILDPYNVVANTYLYKITSDMKYAIKAKQSYYSGNDDFFGLRFFKYSKNFKNPGIVELRDRAFRIRLSLFPHELNFMHDLALSITDNKGDMSEALEITNILLEEEPNNPEFLSTASWVYYNLGDFSGADKFITKALGSLSPDEYVKYPNLFYNIGMIKSAIGDNRSSLYYFEKLLSFKNRDDFDFNKLDYAKRFVESVH